MDVQIVVRDEDLRGVENARVVLGKLIDADLEIGGHGVPPLTLIVDDLESLLSKIKAQRGELPARINEYGRGHVRVLELSAGRITGSGALDDLDGYALGDPKRVTLETQGRGLRG